MATDLFELNPDLDRVALAATFAKDGRVQIRDVLTERSANALRDLLIAGTSWELAWQAGKDGPVNVVSHDQLRRNDPVTLNVLMSQTHEAASRADYAFRYAIYPILRAYLDKRDAGGPFDTLLEHLNSQPMLDLAREISGISEIVKVDAQASLFAANHFLGRHDDGGTAEEGRRVAYVLGMAPDEWSPDWGGYLQFFDVNGDITCGWKPRFNVLNLMLVPCPHSVSYVPPFAPASRTSVTGWFRDK